jgi:aspartate racemase
MHAVFETIERSGNAPMIHIADAMFREICRSNVSTVGLLGTKHTMSSTSYRDRLSGDSELGVLVPYEPDQALINAIIYEELCVGIISDESRRTLLRAADNLVIRGAQVIIAGCTELNLLIRPEDLRVPLLDTTAVHVDALVAAAFQEQF